MPHKLHLNAEGDHYHRCEHCGVLMPCGDTCTQQLKTVSKDGKRVVCYDPYTSKDVAPDGTLPGGHCDSDCYNHRRPKSCRYGELS